MIENGRILFSNLTKFKQIEHEARGDVMEGCHVDAPDHPVQIEIISNGQKICGQFSFRNSINDEKVFVFCVSRTFNLLLFDDFDADICVEINDVDELSRRCSRAIKKKIFIDKVGLLHGPVVYFEKNKDCGENILDGKRIPFLKSAYFRNQDEYRFVYSRTGGLRTKRRIMSTRRWEDFPDHLDGKPKSTVLEIGSLRDICCLRGR